ncbi:hypothetical protein TNCV_4733081 [Trichonephila clavipes]|nr:hypothetical protein TNCV_4733081 [Trichonephila clavipes]
MSLVGRRGLRFFSSISHTCLIDLNQGSSQATRCAGCFSVSKEVINQHRSGDMAHIIIHEYEVRTDSTSETSGREAQELPAVSVSLSSRKNSRVKEMGGLCGRPS